MLENMVDKLSEGTLSNSPGAFLLSNHPHLSASHCTL